MSPADIVSMLLTSKGSDYGGERGASDNGRGRK